MFVVLVVLCYCSFSILPKQLVQALMDVVMRHCYVVQAVSKKSCRTADCTAPGTRYSALKWDVLYRIP